MNWDEIDEQIAQARTERARRKQEYDLWVFALVIAVVFVIALFSSCTWYGWGNGALNSGVVFPSGCGIELVGNFGPFCGDF